MPHAPLLAAGELPRVVAHPIRETDERLRGAHVLAPLAPAQVGEQQWQLDVLEGDEHRDELYRLALPRASGAGKSPEKRAGSRFPLTPPRASVTNGRGFGPLTSPGGGGA
jgi:hypothetical protein